MWIESRMLWTSLFAIYWMQIVYQKQLLNAGLIKPGEVGDFFALVSMKSPNFCQKAKF